MKYVLVCEFYNWFSDKVNEYLKDGYSLRGKTFILHENNAHYFCQVLIKEEN